MEAINSNNGLEIHIIDADKIGSATSPLNLGRKVAVVPSSATPRAGDVVVVRALTDSAPITCSNYPPAGSPKSIRATS